MNTIQEFFKNGLDRSIPELWQPPSGMQINVGPGNKKEIQGTIGVGRGSNKLSDYEWEAPRSLRNAWCIGSRVAADAMGIPEVLPYGEIAAIHCYQFIEHFEWDEVHMMLRDWEKALKPGGVINIAVPHVAGSMAFQALDHKTYWNEEVINWLFGNEYYDDHEQSPWRLRPHCCFIMGVVLRNLNLFIQLVKE